jgi:hypothetical protein
VGGGGGKFVSANNLDRRTRFLAFFFLSVVFAALSLRTLLQMRQTVAVDATLMLPKTSLCNTRAELTFSMSYQQGAWLTAAGTWAFNSLSDYVHRDNHIMSKNTRDSSKQEE